MKRTSLLFVFFVLYLLTSNYYSFAQDMTFQNYQTTSCLSSEQRASMMHILEENRETLKREKLYNLTKAKAAVQFIWPVRQAKEFSYTSTWAISNYVDHSTIGDFLEDYNCGTRTYSGHMDIDITLWPFCWEQMENNQTEVIAAADGQIIAKIDGNFDKQCDFNFFSWNVVYVEHADGSVAWYGHLKEGESYN